MPPVHPGVFSILQPDDVVVRMQNDVLPNRARAGQKCILPILFVWYPASRDKRPAKLVLESTGERTVKLCVRSNLEATCPVKMVTRWGIQTGQSA